MLRWLWKNWDRLEWMYEFGAFAQQSGGLRITYSPDRFTIKIDHPGDIHEATSSDSFWRTSSNYR